MQTCACSSRSLSSWRHRTAAHSTPAQRLPPDVPGWPPAHRHLLRHARTFLERYTVGGEEALLGRLAALGIASLPERRAAVHALATEWTSGRLADNAPTSASAPLPTPTSVLGELEAKLALAATAESSERLASLEPARRCDALEALGLPWSHARLLSSCLPELLRRRASVAAARSSPSSPSVPSSPSSSSSSSSPSGQQPIGEHRIAFWSDQMCERGTEVALFDYADGAERILGASAYVLYNAKAPNNYAGMIGRFAERFGDRLMGLEAGWAGVDAVLEAHGIGVVYAIKCNNDRLVSKLRGVRTCIHCVFDAGDPYGDV